MIILADFRKNVKDAFRGRIGEKLIHENSEFIDCLLTKAIKTSILFICIAVFIPPNSNKKTTK